MIHSLQYSHCLKSLVNQQQNGWHLQRTVNMVNELKNVNNFSSIYSRRGHCCNGGNTYSIYWKWKEKIVVCIQFDRLIDDMVTFLIRYCLDHCIWSCLYCFVKFLCSNSFWYKALNRKPKWSWNKSKSKSFESIYQMRFTYCWNIVFSMMKRH